MHRLLVLSCIFCLYGIFGLVRAADKYTDENRPYEFGFTIDGEQHRHEKKDENGIIMGEFGFITADGVYHVTVYATDEQGRFKILSMKNIRVKPYPTAGGGGGMKKGHSIPFPPSEKSAVVQGPSTSNALSPGQESKNLNPQQESKNLSPNQESKPLEIKKQISSPAKSCSHCSLPTTTTKAPPPQLTDIAVVSKDRPVLGTLGQATPNNNQQNTLLSKSSGQNSVGHQEIGNSAYPGLGQNNLKYPEFNSRNSFGDVQQNYQQQDYSRNVNSPPDSPKLDYPQQNNNENLNIPQSNQFYNQNEDNIRQTNLQLGNKSPQSNPSNNNGGNQYYTPEETNVGYNNPQTQNIADNSYPQHQPNNVQSEASSIPPYPGQEPSYSLQTPKDTSRNPKQYNDISTPVVEPDLSQGFRNALASLPDQPAPNKPTLLAAQMQIVPKDTDVHQRYPGEEEGLPHGISKDDMTHLLYTFNYTVGFHGHHEEGYSNGAKKGYYYVTGRNGIRTRVDYIADEKGFRPRISQEVLDLLSDDVPKPETEKDEKFGLKGYEFKWLYYPTNERN